MTVDSTGGKSARAWICPSINSFIRSPLKLKMGFSNLGVSDVSNSVYCIFLRMEAQLDWTL